MTFRNKLSSIFGSKEVQQKHEANPLFRSRQPRSMHYVTLGSTSYMQRQPKIINRMHRIRKNHTQIRKQTGLSELATINKFDKRYASISHSKSIQLRNEQLEQSRLLAQREQKLNKLKGLYSMKNKKRYDELERQRVYSKAKINSYNQKSPTKSSSVMKSRYKDLILFTKKEAFHYQKSSEDLSQRSLPKYLDYCEEMVTKFGKDKESQERQHQLPQLLKHQHLIGKIRSMKKIPQTPPLMPVTIRHNSVKTSPLTLEWLNNYYIFKLQTFQDLKKSGFKRKECKNGIYFGELNQGGDEPEGRGVLFYDNGKVFEGNFKQGQREGLGYEEFPDSSFYLGNFMDGKREGRGKFQWSNGEVYDGEWKSNLKSGSGIWKGANGQSYVGEWRQDSMEGFGVLIDQESRYEGQFKSYLKWGSGTIRFDNGETYTGSFRQNMPNGQGDYYWTNGDHYHGEFLNGKRHGEGALRYANGGIYRGQFHNDKKSGRGQQYYEDSLHYEGDFENDFRHGLGKLFCEDRLIFDGYWINNSAVDPRQGKIQTIIEERESVLEQTKPHRLDMHESYLGKARSRQLVKKHQASNVFKVGKYSPPKPSPLQQAVHRNFQRACNCDRHRRKRENVQF